MNPMGVQIDPRDFPDGRTGAFRLIQFDFGTEVLFVFSPADGIDPGFDPKLILRDKLAKELFPCESLPVLQILFVHAVKQFSDPVIAV